MSGLPERGELFVLLCEATGAQLDAGKLEARTLHELELDSLALIELSIMLEDRFGLELDLDALKSDTTIGDLLSSLHPMVLEGTAEE